MCIENMALNKDRCNEKCHTNLERKTQILTSGWKLSVAWDLYLVCIWLNTLKLCGFPRTAVGAITASLDTKRCFFLGRKSRQARSKLSRSDNSNQGQSRGQWPPDKSVEMRQVQGHARNSSQRVGSGSAWYMVRQGRLMAYLRQGPRTSKWASKYLTRKGVLLPRRHLTGLSHSSVIQQYSGVYKSWPWMQAVNP